jgi:hypothetical protein
MAWGRSMYKRNTITQWAKPCYPCSSLAALRARSVACETKVLYSLGLQSVSSKEMATARYQRGS